MTVMTPILFQGAPDAQFLTACEKTSPSAHCTGFQEDCVQYASPDQTTKKSPRELEVELPAALTDGLFSSAHFCAIMSCWLGPFSGLLATVSNLGILSVHDL